MEWRVGVSIVNGKFQATIKVVRILVVNDTLNLKRIEGEVFHDGLENVTINSIPAKGQVHVPRGRICCITVRTFPLLAGNQFCSRRVDRRNKRGRIGPLLATKGIKDFSVRIGRTGNLGDGSQIFNDHGEFRRGRLVQGLRSDGGRTERSCKN